MSIETINPATGALIKHYDTMPEKEVDQIIEAMYEAQSQWREVPLTDRIKKMNKLGELLDKDAKTYAKVITEEMGKPITQAEAEVHKCATLCRYYAEQAETLLAPEMIETTMSKTYRCFEPLGIIFAIMPWNFPFWQVFRFAVPNLLGGNAGLLKHAPNSTEAALVIEKLFVKAGFPENLFRSLIIDVDLAPHVIQHPHIAAVTLTGSNRAGKAVGALAGAACKKVVLELGGSDPYIILEDADLDLAAEQCVLSRLTNAGQICISAKRLIVVESIKSDFMAKVMALASEYECGAPLLAETKLGPLARADLRDKLQQQVDDSVAKGAKVLLGGQPVVGQGYFYPATILDNVQKGMPAYDQELFGPVISFITVKDEAEAIQIANDNQYGLGAVVFTKDLERGETIAAYKLKAGTCNVNTLVTSNPAVPFGGIKNSGYGRELSVEGMRELMNIKTVNIN